jgi:signal transduction histidine kinase
LLIRIIDGGGEIAAGGSVPWQNPPSRDMLLAKIFSLSSPLRSLLPALNKYRSKPSCLKPVLALCSLLCLMSCVGAAQENGNPVDFNTNTPNIYVDYNRTIVPTRAEVASTNGLGCWIWDKQTLDKQTIHLWQSFNIPESNPATHAELRISADNAFRVWMDGQEIGSGSDWRTLSIYELSGKLDPGTHVLAVEGFNDCDKAGVIVGLHLKLANGQALHMQSDTNWRVVPISVSGWQTAKRPADDWPMAVFVANLRQPPWWGVPKAIAYIQESIPEPVPFWRTSRFQFILFVGCGAFMIIGFCLLIQLVIQSKTHSSLQIERDRIARDLHDDLGSKITQLLLIGEASQIRDNILPHDNASTEPILQMCEEARDILTTIDEIIWIVNSQHNTLNDFSIHVCKYTERFLESTPIRFRFDVEYELPPKTLPQLVRRNLVLAVKEALNNAVKHSHATELIVRIKLEDSTFIVMAEDNGIGFDYQKVNPERNGLNNMTLRMKEIGGDFKVITRLDEGCKVCLGFPINNSGFRRLLYKPAYQNSSAPIHGYKDGKGLVAKQIK